MRKLIIFLVLVVLSIFAPLKPVVAETTVPKFEAVACPAGYAVIYLTVRNM